MCVCWRETVCVLCYLLWGFMGCLCGFSKCEFEFKVVLCRCVDCSAPYQQCRQHTLCVCVCGCVSHQWCCYVPCVRHRWRPSWPEEHREVRMALREQHWHTHTHTLKWTCCFQTFVLSFSIQDTFTNYFQLCSPVFCTHIYTQAVHSLFQVLFFSYTHTQVAKLWCVRWSVKVINCVPRV